MRAAIREANPSRPSSPHRSARSIRLYEPKRLMTSGKSHPSIRSNNNARPPRAANAGSKRMAESLEVAAAAVDSATARMATSSSGDTGSLTRTSSPHASSSCTKLANVLWGGAMARG